MIKPPDGSVSKVGGVAAGSPVERVRGDVARLLVAVQQAGAPGPGFAVGEAVSARLVEPLQNRQWLAVVKNTVITLQWPAATAMPTQGTTLPLQVVSATPRLTFALVEAAPSTPAHGAVAVQLSAAAQTLNALVQAGAHGSLPASVAVPAPLMSDPTAPHAERALAVAQAVVHSGLFYESHLRAWAEGRMPLAALGAEPQARLQHALQDASPATRETATAELGSVLQRQLDALDGKPLAFAGVAWPGQAAEWRIQREAPDAQGEERGDGPDDNPADDPGKDGSDPSGTERSPAWTTQLRLALPRLGSLGASLRVAGTQVTLAMTLDNDAGASLLATHRERLASAMQAAGLSLSALSVTLTADQSAPHDGRAEEA